jgi:hypothetical protein
MKKDIKIKTLYEVQITDFEAFWKNENKRKRNWYGIFIKFGSYFFIGYFVFCILFFK